MRPAIAVGACCLICTTLVAERRLALQGHQEPPAGGSLVGIVVDAESKPLPDARVQVRSIDSPADLGSAVTKDSGTFSIDHLRPGTYILSASRTGFVATEYGATRPRGAGTPLVLSTGASLDSLTIPLHLGGVITGTVRRPDGSRLNSGSVAIYEERIASNGHRTWVMAASSPIDDRSIYRAFGLAPGTYAIRAMFRETGSTTTGRAWAPTFYPNAMTLTGAGRVTIGPADEQSGVDITVADATTVRIEGHVIAPASSRPLQPRDLELDPVDPIGTASGGGIAQILGDQFTLRGVFPGDYRLQARLAVPSPADSLSASRLLSVGTADIVGADLLLRPSAVLTGRLVVEVNSTRVDISNMRVRLRSMDPTIPPSAEPADGKVSSDGTFVVAVVASGSYRVEVPLAGPTSIPAAWLKSIVVDAHDMSDAAIDFGDGQTVSALITVTDQLGTIRGTLTGADGRPATEYTIIAFPRSRDLWGTLGRRIRTSRPANTGAFVIRGLPDGEYRLAAVVDPEINAWLMPTFLDALTQASVPAVVVNGSTTVKDLRVPKSPDR